MWLKYSEKFPNTEKTHAIDVSVDLGYTDTSLLEFEEDFNNLASIYIN